MLSVQCTVESWELFRSTKRPVLNVDLTQIQFRTGRCPPATYWTPSQCRSWSGWSLPRWTPEPGWGNIYPIISQTVLALCWMTSSAICPDFTRVGQHWIEYAALNVTEFIIKSIHCCSCLETTPNQYLH